MTPHRRRKLGKAVGSLVLSWQRKPVGLIYRATGLEDNTLGRRQLARMSAACETLFQLGRLDILAAVRDGQVHPMQLLQAQRAEQLRALPTAEHLALVAPLITPWIAATVNSDTRKGRAAVWRALEAAQASVTLGHLPLLVSTVMQQKIGTPAQANRIREVAMAFVRDTIGLTHPIHLQLEALGAFPTSPVRKKIHLTPEEFHAKLEQLGPARDAFYGMCLTGMNPKEFWGPWAIDGAGVAIEGTKAKGRVRVVPLLAPITRPTVSRDVLIWWLNKAGLYPYCARHSYSRWLSDALLPDWRQKAYMGHSAGNQTQAYQRGDMRSYLVGDAAALRTVLLLDAPPAQMSVSA